MKKFLSVLVLLGICATASVFAKDIYRCSRCKGTGKIQVSRQVTCHACGGKKEVCNSCHGTGWVKIPATNGPWGFPEDRIVCTNLFCVNGYMSCPTCGNTGVVWEFGTSDCPRCGGTGSVAE